MTTTDAVALARANGLWFYSSASLDYLSPDEVLEMYNSGDNIPETLCFFSVSSLVDRLNKEVSESIEEANETHAESVEWANKVGLKPLEKSFLSRDEIVEKLLPIWEKKYPPDECMIVSEVFSKVASSLGIKMPNHKDKK